MISVPTPTETAGRATITPRPHPPHASQLLRATEWYFHISFIRLQKKILLIDIPFLKQHPPPRWREGLGPSQLPPTRPHSSSSPGGTQESGAPTQSPGLSPLMLPGTRIPGPRPSLPLQRPHFNLQSKLVDTVEISGAWTGADIRASGRHTCRRFLCGERSQGTPSNPHPSIPFLPGNPEGLEPAIWLSAGGPCGTLHHLTHWSAARSAPDASLFTPKPLYLQRRS